MRTSTLSLGALAVGLAAAHTYPNCVSEAPGTDCLTRGEQTLTPDCRIRTTATAT
jgi:hypothetical protein